MKFDDLDRRMRRYETAADYCVLPGLYMVARLDGRGFTRLTKERHRFDTPFDERFRDYMIGAARHLMQCGFDVLYAYTQSDEISLLFHRDVSTFDRTLRKYNSVLAGEASAAFSLLLGDHAVFDCRISQLPTVGGVARYFLWRAADAHRNALNAHCYWLLRGKGNSVAEATSALHTLSTAGKHDLLFADGINFNALPGWQKQGVGLYWESYAKVSVNPLTDLPVKALRRRIRIDLDLPVRELYAVFVRELLVGIPAEEP